MASDLSLDVSVSKNMDRCYHATEIASDEVLPMAKVVAKLRTSTPLSKVRVTFATEAPLTLLNHTTTIQSLSKSSDPFCWEIVAR